MINLLQPKIICPFCFAHFSPEEVRFRCTQPTVRCSGWENDDIYAKKRHIPSTKMGHVFEINRSLQEGKKLLAPGISHSAPCDVCYADSYTHICPECHFELSHDVGQVKQRIIAVIGGSGTGKSHYIGSLIFSLKANTENDLIVTLLSDSTQQRWMEDFYLPVFERRTVLPGTVPAASNARVRAPLMVRLTSRENEWKRRMGLRDQVINTSIFDASGEDMAELNVLSAENKAIVHADGLIFMIDPLQIESVRQQLQGVRASPPDPRTLPDNMLGRMVTLFETAGHVKPGNGKIRVPTAFVLSKVDMLENIVYKGSAFLRPAMHGAELRREEIQSVSTEVSNYLRSWLLPNFCDTIERRFSSYSYFGVSSLGRQSNTQSRLEVVEPLRVEEPFLWLLSELGFVRCR